MDSSASPSDFLIPDLRLAHSEVAKRVVTSHLNNEWNRAKPRSGFLTNLIRQKGDHTRHRVFHDAPSRHGWPASATGTTNIADASFQRGR